MTARNLRWYQDLLHTNHKGYKSGLGFFVCFVLFQIPGLSATTDIAHLNKISVDFLVISEYKEFLRLESLRTDFKYMILLYL